METESRTWHGLSTGAAAAAQGVVPAQGLSSGEAAERLARAGENRLAEAKPRLLWLKFLDQFKNFLVIVLLLAAVPPRSPGSMARSCACCMFLRWRCA